MRMIAGVSRGWRETDVYLDGIMLSRCTEADSAEGWADVIACDDAGNVITELGEIKTERLRGRVEFRKSA